MGEWLEELFDQEFYTECDHGCLYEGIVVPHKHRFEYFCVECARAICLVRKREDRHVENGHTVFHIHKVKREPPAYGIWVGEWPEDAVDIEEVRRYSHKGREDAFVLIKPPESESVRIINHLRVGSVPHHCETCKRHMPGTDATYCSILCKWEDEDEDE